jgi:hypothetical protein
MGFQACGTCAVHGRLSNPVKFLLRFLAIRRSVVPGVSFGHSEVGQLLLFWHSAFMTGGVVNDRHEGNHHHIFHHIMSSRR